MSKKACDQPIFLNSAGIICSLGSGLKNVEDCLFSNEKETAYLKNSPEFSAENNMLFGTVEDSLAPVSVTEEDTRNNRMLTTAAEPLLNQINLLISRFGPQRIATVIGTSTSGISAGEEAMRYYRKQKKFPENYHYRMQEQSAPSRYLAKWLGLLGPAYSVSSACTSGAKALASAARLLKLDVCDAVIAGGVDTLCQMTVQGFSSLLVTTDSVCNPFSINRNGINIGEGAGLFLMTREPGPVRLTGVGETSDAYHISSPHPEGTGAENAMRQALQQARMKPQNIGYLNLHGTGTEQNDKMEAKAVKRVFGSDIACSSTKPFTGHTLAAAGAIEAIFCWLALQRNDGRIPPHRWDDQPDPELPVLTGITTTKIGGKLSTAMSNSFAFGGNNTSLILERE